jgi:hypothetical protein
MFFPCVIDEMEVPAVLSCPFDAMDTEFDGAGARPSLPIPPDNESNPKALRQP